MSTTEPAAKKSRYLLTDWNPNDESTWDSKLAWRTLWITTYSLILAFCVWFLPSAIAPKLTLLGFNLDKSQLYWLTALPGLAAGILRLIYMFLPPLIGTRKLVGITSLLCILPMAGWFYVVQDNTTHYWVLLTLAFMCGIGGGAFSGYMPSTGYFFPKRLSGTALGLQGGIGNLGMSVIQLVGPILMGFGLFGMTWRPRRRRPAATTRVSTSGSTTPRSSSFRGALLPRSSPSSGCATCPSRPTSSSSSISSPTPTPGT